MATEAIEEFLVVLSMMITPDNSTAKNRKLSFTLLDTTPSPADAAGPHKIKAVGKKDDQTATLAIAPDKERFINVTLSDDWDWSFSDDPLTVRTGDVRNYTVERKSASTIRIRCKPTHADPKFGQDDKLDFSVLLKQHEGRSVLVTIDPVTENPPPTQGGGGDIKTSNVPLPIA